MGERQKECQECGWRGVADELDETSDDSSGETQIFCPNCGGGFQPRPVRPARNWKGDNYLGRDPAGTTVRHRPVDPGQHARFAAAIRDIPPRLR